MSTFWIDRPTFVTGGTGLLGRWLVKRLVEVGARVICLVRKRPSKAEFANAGLPAQTQQVEGDIRDQALLERIIGDRNVRTIMHIAAKAIVTDAIADPVPTLSVNIEGTWSLLEACRRTPGVEQILLASSDKAYGEAERLPVDEKAPLQGLGPYEASKACADLIGHAYARAYGLPLAITRCGNFFGGGDLHWNRIVPGTIRTVLRGKRPMIRTDGLFVRDYFYIEDAAAAYLLLAEALAARPELRGQAFNFSNEERTTVLDIVSRIVRLMGSDLEPEVRGEPSTEIREQLLSAEKARRLLGWSARYTLDEGLLHTIEWYKTFFERTEAGRAALAEA
jgi:CDP-glucose 4,6-dehydratase